MKNGRTNFFFSPTLFHRSAALFKSPRRKWPPHRPVFAPCGGRGVGRLPHRGHVPVRRGRARLSLGRSVGRQLVALRAARQGKGEFQPALQAVVRLDLAVMKEHRVLHDREA